MEVNRKDRQLEQFMLQSHIILWLETNAGLENVHQSTSLLSKSINDRSARGGQGCLKHEAEDAKYAVEILKILSGSTIAGMSLPLDTSHHLCDDNQINDQG